MQERRAFVLPPPTEETLSIFGTAVHYRIENGELSASGGGAKADTRIALDDVRAVRLAAWAEMRMCEMTDAAGKRASIVTDDAASRPGYRRFVAELHGELAAREGITYRRGGWGLMAGMAAIGAAVIAAALVFERPSILILAALWVVLGPLLLWRTRPRSYDPRALPDDLLS